MSQSEDEEFKRREAEKVERVRLENLQTIKEWHRTAGEREEAKAKAETDAQERRKAHIRDAIETTERIKAWLAAPYDGSGALKFSGLGNPPTWFPDFHQERCLEIQKRIYSDPNFTPRNSPAQLQFWMECREWPHIDQVPIEYREAVAYLNMLLDAYLLGEFDGSKALNRPGLVEDAKKGEAFSQTQSARAKKPRGKIGEGGETTISNLIKTLATASEYKDDTAKELWGHFYSRLDELHLDPKETENPAEPAKGTIEYDAASGKRGKITFGRFANSVAENRKSR